MNIATTVIGSPKSVLLFDEHSMSRHGVVAALARSNPGWDVVTASRLSEFLRYTDARNWDLLLLDHPTLSADTEEMLRFFRHSCPGSRIVMLNGPEDDAVRALLAAAGADGYLSKFAAPEELAALVASLLTVLKPDPAKVVSRAASSILLTDRQAVVLSLMAEGRSTKDIARRLGLAVGTVKAHLSGTYRALGAHSRVEALAKAGMIESSGRLFS